LDTLQPSSAYLHPGAFAFEQSAPGAVTLNAVEFEGVRRDAAALARRMRLLYGLSSAEARVMAEVALGADVEEIMLKHGVRESTVRSQLKNIFSKTGTSRQSDLVRLALEGTPLVPDWNY
jgi:DNA-binding CsgD family transcriptional regulator